MKSLSIPLESVVFYHLDEPLPDINGHNKPRFFLLNRLGWQRLPGPPFHVTTLKRFLKDNHLTPRSFIGELEIVFYYLIGKLVETKFIRL